MDIQKENVGFGDFCSIEQKRYGAQNEFYGYKVVNRLRSNSWICVPVDARDQKPKLHDEVFDVVEVISLTAGCNVIERFRVIDLARAWTTKAQVPEGFVLVPREPTEEMLGAAWEAPPAGGPSGNRRTFYEKQAVVYKAMIEEAEKEMIEAQEPAND